MPAEVVIEVGADEALDTTTIRVLRVDDAGRPLLTESSGSLPFRWYDAAIPYDFPEFNDSVSRTAGELQP